MIKYIALIPILLIVSNIHAQENNSYWPKQIELQDYTLTFYQPEPERFEGNTLDARAAFSIFDGEHLPIFGAIWFTCRVHTNTKSNEVYFENIQVVNANFPQATAENVEGLQTLIAEVAPGWHFNSDLRRFYEELKTLNINNAYGEELRNNPPIIFYSKEPAILVFIDGDPVLANINGSELYKYVVNTPHFIIKSSSDQQYYLKGGNWWYTTTDPTGTWKTIETPPSHIRILAEKATELKVKSNTADKNGPGKQPKLIVTKEPAELIQTLGEPEIKQIYENLFSVTNSDDEIIYDSYSDKYFILISGRWYKTRKIDRGPWVSVSPEDLPDIFKDIPPSSFAHVRMSVPGTPESVSAALDNGIPQTAIVDRRKAKMLLEYDGQPQFESIPGTSLSYGVNTGGSVIKGPDSLYYAVDQAVWFTSENANGPWKIATHFPDEVRKIPPSCPVFNMKFVYIYDYTDEIVYVGYTGGYLGAFLYHGLVYYGTGYRYKSWFGDKYIPRPTTYGYGAKKKSSGSSSNVQFYAGVGYGGPMLGMGFGGYGMGYGGYGGYGMGMGYGGYGGYGMWNQMAYNQYYYQGQTVAVDHDIIEEKPIDLENIYSNRSEGIIRTETAPRNDPMKPVIIKGGNIPDHMYADKNGNLYRRDKDGKAYELRNSNWHEIEEDQ